MGEGEGVSLGLGWGMFPCEPPPMAPQAALPGAGAQYHTAASGSGMGLPAPRRALLCFGGKTEGPRGSSSQSGDTSRMLWGVGRAQEGLGPSPAPGTSPAQLVPRGLRGGWDLLSMTRMKKAPC